MVGVHVHVGPQWFFGMDASLEAAAAVIALLIAISAFKIFRVTKDKKYFYFMGSFILLLLSFLSRAFADVVVEGIIVKVPDGWGGLIFFLGYLSHIFLALAAYLILFAVTYKITDKRVLSLIFLLLIPGLLLSGSYFLSFYVSSALFLVYITYAYFKNCCKVKRWASRLVFVGFVFITLAQIFFLLDAVTKRQGYVLAQISQGLGYLTLLAALLRTLFK